MADPPDNQRPTGPVAGGIGLPVVRAAVVLVVFVASTVLLLGLIHPTTASSAMGTASTPTTTVPAHSSTSTTVRSAPTTTTIPPSHVAVVVANASGVNGAAAAVTAELQPGGWDMLAPTNATATLATSQVYYVAGQQQPAASIAASLQLPATAVAPYTTAAPISSIGTADVLVVVAPDLATKATTPTTTTVPVATTTTKPAHSTTTSKH